MSTLVAIGFVLLPLVYAILFFVWVSSWRDVPRRGSGWLGAAAILSAAPFFLWLGVFGSGFSSGQCYSTLIGGIRDELGAGVQRQDLDQIAALSRRLSSLRLAGYETSCDLLAEQFESGAATESSGPSKPPAP